MSVYVDVLIAIAPLFALILLGYVGKKTRLLHFTDAPVLNRFVISITLPAFIFHAVLTHQLKPELIQLPFVFWIAEFVMLCLGIGLGTLLKWQPASIGTLIMQTVFGNTGFIGYPMTSAILPTRLPGAVIIDQFGMSIPLLSGSPVLGSVFGKTRVERTKFSSFQFMKSPVFIALVLSLALKLIPDALVPTSPLLIQAGRLLMQTVGLIGGATIPVVLISVGILLRPSSLGEHAGKVAVIGVMKLIVLPVLVWCIAKFGFHMAGSFLAVCVLEAAMPPATVSTVFTAQYDLDSSLAIAAFFALTIVSAVTLPLMLGLLR